VATLVVGKKKKNNKKGCVANLNNNKTKQNKMKHKHLVTQHGHKGGKNDLVNFQFNQSL